ncbi:MAG: DUF4349 domain-containing protein [Clostridia bacterium]|nr:DUF4349 domain-containing protein [Clostridia bacterium]
MRRVLYAALLLAVCASLIFCGCSRKASQDQGYPEGGVSYAENGSIFDNAASNEGSYAPADPADASTPDVAVGRKLIKDAKLVVETLEYDKLYAGLTENVRALGGYVESFTVGEKGSYAYASDSLTRPLRRASMVVRIPAEKLDEFLSNVEGLGNVISKAQSTKDITDSYVDTEARLASLRTEYDTLLGLLEKASSLDEILTLQERLTEVRYSIESYERTIRTYDSQIAFSTVSLEISEVERVTPVEEETFGQEIKRRFGESMEDVGMGLRDFAAWFIGDLPHIVMVLLFFVALPLAIVLIIVKSVKKKNRRRAAKAAEQAEKTV